MIPAETCRRTEYTKNDRHNDTAVSRLLSFSSHHIRFEYAVRLSTSKGHPFYHTSQRRPPRPAAAQVPYHHNTILLHHHTPPPAGRIDDPAAATSARDAADPPTLTPTPERRRDAGLIPALRLPCHRAPRPDYESGFKSDYKPACWQAPQGQEV